MNAKSVKIKNGDEASRLRHRDVLNNSNGKSVLSEIKAGDKCDDSDQVSVGSEFFPHLLISSP